MIGVCQYPQAEATAEAGDADEDEVTGRERLSLKQLHADIGNSLEIATSIMQDRDLQISCRMMIAVAVPFREEYLEMLRKDHRNQRSTAERLALRSMSSWSESCKKIVATTRSWAVLRKFGLRSSEGAT